MDCADGIKRKLKYMDEIKKTLSHYLKIKIM